MRLYLTHYQTQSLTLSMHRLPFCLLSKFSTPSAGSAYTPFPLTRSISPDKAALNGIFLPFTISISSRAAELDTLETVGSESSQQAVAENTKGHWYRKPSEQPGLVMLKAVNRREDGDQQRTARSCHVQRPEEFLRPARICWLQMTLRVLSFKAEAW